VHSALPRLPGWALLALLLLAAVHLAGGAGWLLADQLIFDGDEAGHVGAAELIAASWLEGRPLDALRTSFMGPLGVYPPLYAGLLGAWWALLDFGDPARLSVRGLNLLWPLLAAAAVARMARPLGPQGVVVGFAAALMVPIMGGLGRHFMPEGALVAAVSMAAMAAFLARERPSIGRLVVAGLALGLALLVKQTAPLYLAPLLVLLLPRRPRSLVVLAVALAVVLPWLVPNLALQLEYGGDSAAGPGLASLPRQLGFYPWSFLWVGAGVPLASLALVGAAVGLRSRDPAVRSSTWVALAWLVGSALLLTCVPRKYPRLLAPALPAVGLLAAVALVQARQLWQRAALWVLLCAALGWMLTGSLWSLPVPASAEVLDDRCPQRWFRPPVGDDLGYSAVIDAVAAAPVGPVRVVGSAEIPCELQTTPGWSEHLGPLLRFHGLDRELLRDDQPGDAVLIISWEGARQGWAGSALSVPVLQGEIWIGRPVR